MNKMWTIAAAVIIGFSIVINIFLYSQNQTLRFMIETCATSEKVYILERKIINSLIPKINPSITKEQLLTTINSIIPGEKVYVFKDQVQWRLYRFWFSGEDRLIDVTYGS